MAKLDSVARIIRLQELNTTSLMAFPNVVGTGTGYRQRKGKFTKETVVQVFVQRKYPLQQLPDWAVIPKTLLAAEGNGTVQIDVIEVGFVYAAQDTTRYRPVPGGCSIGHQANVDASTLGGWVCDLADDTIVLLTCNHCISNIGVASVPGGIVQPGRLDGGVAPADLIGALKRFIPITTGVVPLPVTPVDAAIGTITVNRLDNVLQIGPAIYETATATLGLAVQKRGRTTRFTTNGTITSVNVQVRVNYGTAGAPAIGLIGNSFIVTSTDGNAFANRGDSGSLIFDQSSGVLNNTFPVVGMFFAVSGGGVTTWHNDISVVFNQLNLTTICDCVVRALIEVILGLTESGSVSRKAVFLKDAQLRRFRDRVLKTRPFGKRLVDFITSETAELFRAIQEDDEAFGLAARTFEPFVRQKTNLDVLETKLDQETAKNFSRLADRVAKVCPNLRVKLSLIKTAIFMFEGKSVMELLRGGKLKQEQSSKRKGSGK